MDQTPKRPLPSPRTPILDQQPERGAVRMPRAEPMKRTQTLPGIPSVPRLPTEIAETVPAPNPLQRLTVRRPTPPSTAELARRTDPPAAPELPPTSIRVPEDEKRSEAPASTSPDAAALAASRADAERLRLKVAELERDKRAAAETKTVSYPPPVTPRPAAPQAPAHPPFTPPETFRGVTLTQAKIGLLMAITAILIPLAPFVAWKVSTIQSGSRRTEDQVAATAKVAEAAKTTAAGSDEAAKIARVQRQTDLLYLIAILKKQGVQVRKPDGWPDLPEIETEAPVRRPGRIDPGPVLIVKTAPSP